MVTPTIYETHRHGQAAADARPLPQASAVRSAAAARLDERPILAIGARYCVGRRSGIADQTGNGQHVHLS
jgi:hypothetical protein